MSQFTVTNRVFPTQQAFHKCSWLTDKKSKIFLHFNLWQIEIILIVFILFLKFSYKTAILSIGIKAMLQYYFPILSALFPWTPIFENIEVKILVIYVYVSSYILSLNLFLCHFSIIISFKKSYLTSNWHLLEY